jgi:hypothetical protein
MCKNLKKYFYEVYFFSVREIILRVSFNFSLRDLFVKPLTPNPSPVGRGEIDAEFL